MILCRNIEYHDTILYAAIAQLVERIHGKDEVLGSNPSRGSKLILYSISEYFLFHRDIMQALKKSQGLCSLTG